MENMRERGIVMIPIEKLHPHKDNPRKDVGDVTELAESIKANGIMQNLTVVPAQDGYTVIIGHRRLAASRLAGLEALPCVIAENLSEKEQISIMLTENMERADLTIYEQATAFKQLSMDFGMTVEEIAKKSGFSESTVRKRVKLAAFDENEFQKACARGATLFDFAELDKLSDPEAQGRALKVIGTSNFKNTLREELERQAHNERMAVWLPQIAAFATQITNKDYVDGEYLKMEYVRNYGSWHREKDVYVPEDKDTIRYFYIVSDRQIDVYKEYDNEEADRKRAERDRIRDEDEANWEEAMTITDRHRKLRTDFILNYGSAKKDLNRILRHVPRALFAAAERESYARPIIGSVFSLFGYQYNRFNTDKEQYDKVYAMLSDLFKKESPEQALLCALYVMLDNIEDGGYCKHAWDTELQRYVVTHQPNKALDNMYAFLTDIGYQVSDEEKQMKDGSHPIFHKYDEGAGQLPGQTSIV